MALQGDRNHAQTRGTARCGNARDVQLAARQPRAAADQFHPRRRGIDGARRNQERRGDHFRQRHVQCRPRQAPPCATISAARNARSCSPDSRRSARSAAASSTARNRCAFSARRCRCARRFTPSAACPRTPIRRNCWPGCGHFKRPPRQTFVVHGEPATAAGFRARDRARAGLERRRAAGAFDASRSDMRLLMLICLLVATAPYARRSADAAPAAGGEPGAGAGRHSGVGGRHLRAGGRRRAAGAGASARRAR